MTNLADKVIAANDEERRKEEPTGPEIDDVGLPLPIPDTKKAWCEYLTARILYLNNRMYKYRGCLWLRDEQIKENKNSYYKLAKYPKKISSPECQYVWRRLKEIVPELDTTKIAVLPDWTFNMETGEFKHETVWTTTPWEEEDG